MDWKRLWLQILAKKAIIGSGILAIGVYFITNPDDPVVSFIRLKFPKIAMVTTALATFLIGSGILKRDKDVKRDIKIYDDPYFTERKIDIFKTESGVATVEKTVSSEPVKGYQGKGKIKIDENF